MIIIKKIFFTILSLFLQFQLFSMFYYNAEYEADVCYVTLAAFRANNIQLPMYN